MTTQTFEKWQCHLCDTGPNLSATTKSCPQCGHSVCSRCPKDENIPTPLGPPALRSPPRATAIYSSPMPRATVSMAPRGNKIDWKRGKDPHPALRLTTPPLAGWWICHNCSYKNNPELCSERCLKCQHMKCSSCSPWTR